MAHNPGWKWPLNCRKAHYFIDHRSLCGQWMNLGHEGFEQEKNDSPDNCSTCRKKLLKKKS